MYNVFTFKSQSVYERTLICLRRQMHIFKNSKEHPRFCAHEYDLEDALAVTLKNIVMWSLSVRIE
uniref:Uncharacterized protein n=1 Tax=Rhizophora mucronata TaxID=61149 RepID=A0A2P2QM28_RHIMU